MTINKCVTTDECDKRYLMKALFWKSCAIFLLGLVAPGSVVVVFATGKWVNNVEQKLEKAMTIHDQLDTLLVRTKPK